MVKVIFLPIIMIALNACSSTNNTQIISISKDDHYTVMAGHTKQSTEYLSRQISFSFKNSALLYSALLWDIETPPCPKGWHLPNDIEWEKLRRTLSIHLTNKTDIIHGVWKSDAKKIKNELPTTILDSDSIIVYNKIARFYLPPAKKQGLNLKKQPSKWSSEKQKKNVMAFRNITSKLKAKAYSLDTSLSIPILTRYSCFCIEDTPISE